MQDYVGEALMDTNGSRLFVQSVAQAMDRATDDNARVLAPGEFARGLPALGVADQVRSGEERRVLVGLQLEGSEVAAHGDPVYVGRQQVGVVTSGTRSPVLKANVALCRMAVGYRDLGTEVEVGKLDGLQKRIPATVVRFPFYDPEKTRPRS